MRRPKENDPKSGWRNALATVADAIAVAPIAAGGAYGLWEFGKTPAGLSAIVVAILVAAVTGLIIFIRRS